MRNSLTISMLAAAALVIVSATAQGQATDPWIGVWKTNLTKSTFSPGPIPKTPATVTIESASGGGIKLITDGTNAQGQPTHTEVIGVFDGKDNPVKGAPVPTATNAFKRIDARTVETQSKVDGKPTVTTRAVVSADGKIMTATQTGQNVQGQAIMNVIVLERQ
jgi:hypothetical protein